MMKYISYTIPHTNARCTGGRRQVVEEAFFLTQCMCIMYKCEKRVLCYVVYSWIFNVKFKKLYSSY